MRRSSSAASDASGIETRFKAPDDVEAKKLVIDMVNGIGFAAIDLGSLPQVAPCMRSALNHPVPSSTSSDGFVDISGPMARRRNEKWLRPMS
jgi:hypothetical protein